MEKKCVERKMSQKCEDNIGCWGVEKNEMKKCVKWKYWMLRCGKMLRWKNIWNEKCNKKCDNNVGCWYVGGKIRWQNVWNEKCHEKCDRNVGYWGTEKNWCEQMCITKMSQKCHSKCDEIVGYCVERKTLWKMWRKHW